MRAATTAVQPESGARLKPTYACMPSRVVLRNTPSLDARVCRRNDGVPGFPTKSSGDRVRATTTPLWSTTVRVHSSWVEA
jgi:hypothetical protein